MPLNNLSLLSGSTGYGRQPYMGWRSQTSLSGSQSALSAAPAATGYLTAAERLALSIQAAKKEAGEAEKEVSSPGQQPRAEERTANGESDVQSSIKEVTSAIVHYCKDSSPSPRVSPRGSVSPNPVRHSPSTNGLPQRISPVPRSSPRSSPRPASPRKLVWLESSFVGSRPITSPETPPGSTQGLSSPDAPQQQQ